MLCNLSNYALLLLYLETLRSPLVSSPVKL